MQICEDMSSKNDLECFMKEVSIYRVHDVTPEEHSAFQRQEFSSIGRTYYVILNLCLPIFDCIIS